MRPLPLLLTVVLLAACTQPEEGDVVLDDETAQSLAHGAQRLGFALDDGDACAAMAEADAIRSQARDGVQSGTVPNDVANEVDAVASEVTADLACEAEDPEDDDPDDEDDGKDEDEDDKDDEDRDDEDDDGDDDKDDKDDKDEDEDDDRGPDGEGPPGQARGGDRGLQGGGGRR